MKTMVRKSDRDALLKKLSFETLISQLSAQFINLPAEEVDGIIEDAQQRICEFLGFDLSALWQWSTDKPDCLVLTHLHSPADGPKKPAEPVTAESFPWSAKQLMEGATVIYNTEDLTEQEALKDLETKRRYGIKSSVSIPLRAGSRPIIGVLSFNMLHTPFVYDPDTVQRLKLVAQIFCNALLRKNTENELRMSEWLLSLAAESAGAGLWSFDFRTGLFWTTDRGREIFGFFRDEVVSLERFEGCIFPPDLPRVQQMIREDSCSSAERFEVEYRIHDESGQWKWVYSKGRRYQRPDGTADRLFGVSIDIHQRKCMEEDLHNRLKEVEALKRRFEGEAYYLREDLAREQGFEQIIGSSAALKKVLAAARQVAMTDATVLLLGETGTGKGLLAHAIHRMNSRKDHPLVTVNCAALPANLIESELFGRERGAFTGAHSRQAGRFEIAHHGTIFLDEIGEMPLELQAKLLRVLQDGAFERLGSSKTIAVDVRVIAATSRDLRSMVRNGLFREDLFYRLNVFPITIPPLRERTEDIVLLAQYFVEKFARKMGKHIETIPKPLLSRLLQYDWPGNVRELEHLVERGVILSPGLELRFGDLTAPLTELEPISDTSLDLASVERQHIIQVMRRTSWKIEGPGGAASILKLHPSTLRFRLKKMGIQRPI
jgi:formate hydrogenlyase transcriptional activator